MKRMLPLFLNTKDMTVEGMAEFGKELVELQKSISWWIGDLALAAKAKLGDENYTQAFPPDTSPGLVSRCEAVAAAYPREDRNPLATWTIHMKHKNKPNRIALVAAAVEAGRTSDEERKHRQELADEPRDRPSWLLCVDVNLFLHRFYHSGAGIEAAMEVAGWIERTVERLREKGLTDVACCFDSKFNHRKELTAEWEDKYKDRPAKDPELGHQLNLVQELLIAKGFACLLIDGMEADDCMASFAKQFPGKVTLLTQDKDCRQCLSDKCNMLLDVEWIEDPTSGEMVPEYKWLSAKQHTEATGIPPNQWVEYQILMGDATDHIKGCVGIGEKGSADLVKEFGTVAAVIQAAKDGDERIKPKKREALIEFEAKHEVTRKLVTLRDDLQVPSTTKI